MTELDQCKSVADRWERAAIRAHKRLLKWAEDAEMIKLAHDDLAEHMHGVKLLRKGKIVEAYNYASYMDTASREDIPVTVWRYLETRG